MRNADFNQFMQLKNQLTIAAGTFGREQNPLPVLIPTMGKDMDEKLKLAHKVIDLVDPAKRKIFLTLLRCLVEKDREFICSSPNICKEYGGR